MLILELFVLTRGAASFEVIDQGLREHHTHWRVYRLM